MLHAKTKGMKDREMDKESFEMLLRVLDEDRDQAGERYEEIRKRLCQFFARRECKNTVELADCTLNRVARRLSEGVPIETSIINFSFGVARNVFLEDLRLPDRNQGVLEEVIDFAVAPLDEEDPRLPCLRKCLIELPEQDRDLIIRWHKPADKNRGEKQSTLRDELCHKLGMKESTVRARTTKLRAKLQKCVRTCLGSSETQQNR